MIFRLLIFRLLTAAFLAIFAVLPVGCANLDRYDRSYSFSYGEAKATVTLHPRSPR